MKLLLDQGLPRSTVELLCQSGFTAEHVSDIDLSNAEDTEILQRAFDNEQIIITLDSDFHTLLALSCAEQPSVIRIRIEGLRAESLFHLLKHVLEVCRENLQQGYAVTVEPSRIRMRSLPFQ